MTDLVQATEVMTILARSNERLVHISNKVRRLPGVSKVSRALDLRDLRSGPTLEAYVEAELDNGTARAMWVELGWSLRVWTLESSVLANEPGAEQRVIREFPQEEILSLEELDSKLLLTIERLEASISELLSF